MTTQAAAIPALLDVPDHGSVKGKSLTCYNKCFLPLQRCKARRALTTNACSHFYFASGSTVGVQNSHLELIQSPFENQWELLHQFWWALDQLAGSQSTIVKMTNIQHKLTVLLNHKQVLLWTPKMFIEAFTFFIWIFSYPDILNFLPEKQNSND